MNDTSWKRLIEKIRENNVVPIIGPRLMVGTDGQTSLQGQFALRMLQECGMEAGDSPLPPFHEMNEAVSRLKEKGTPLQELYDCAHEAIRKTISSCDFVTPEPIRKLAEISGFRLFVTLTPDDLLARSLRKYCAVNEIIHSPNLPTSESKDLPRDWQTRPGEVQLLYLFGKSRSAPMFAIHDEDVLEYAHNLISRGSQAPGAFLAELQQRNLLMIGCNFPDWLSRFFLRAMNLKRLSEKDKRSWLIEQPQPEESLTCFLRSYTKETEVLSHTSAAQFVSDLHDRWMCEYGDESKAPGDNAEDTLPCGITFFISYSRKTDLPCAEALYRSLLKQGVIEGEMWFDRETIEPGQDFQDRILDGIRRSRYFLPILSVAANSRDEGFFIREWNEANLRLKSMNREFVLPVIVDADYEPERYTAKPVRVWEGLDFGHAPEGVPDGRLEAKLKKLVRDSRRGD